MRVNDDIELDESELEERFVRASGPGGQHVNKTSSAVQLRFDLRSNTSIPAGARARLSQLAGSRLTKDGVLVLSSEDTRSQVRNREMVREKLRALILQALIEPKTRLRRKPPVGAVRRQKAQKARRSVTKTLRRKPKSDD